MNERKTKWNRISRWCSTTAIWVPIRCMSALFLVAAYTRTRTLSALTFYMFRVYIDIYLFTLSFTCYRCCWCDKTKNLLSELFWIAMRCNGNEGKTKWNEKKRSETNWNEDLASQHNTNNGFLKCRIVVCVCMLNATLEHWNWICEMPPLLVLLQLVHLLSKSSTMFEERRKWAKAGK